MSDDRVSVCRRFYEEVNNSKHNGNKICVVNNAGVILKCYNVVKDSDR